MFVVYLHRTTDCSTFSIWALLELRNVINFGYSDEDNFKMESKLIGEWWKDCPPFFLCQTSNLSNARP